MEDKISIIIPTYNNELYICRCLDSILSQTYSNIEILVLNDGSTDNTKDLINSKYSSVNKVKYFEHKNSGVSVTRNAGIKLATGKYIMFVDGDDWLDECYVANCYQYLKKNNLNIVKTGYIIDNGAKKLTKISYFDDSINLLDSNEIKNTLLYSTFFNACWGQLIEKKLLIDVLFSEELICGEDLLFNIRLYNKEPKIGFLSENYYHYFLNEVSVTKRKDSRLALKKCRDIIKVINSLYLLDFDTKLVSKKMFYETDHYLRQYIVLSCDTIRIKINEINRIIELDEVRKSRLLLDSKRDTKFFSTKKWIMVLLLQKKKIFTYIILTQIYSKLKRR